MHIIFDKAIAENHYTLLELDTFVSSDNEAITAYCVIDSATMAAEDLFHLDARVKLHEAMMDCYKRNDYSACLAALQILKGYWKGEMGSFYDIIELRIAELKG
jgi:hypothetical protein